MRINVTNEDIEGAEWGCETCPISRAVSRETGEDYVATDPQYCHLGIRQNRSGTLPPKAQRFVRLFDAGRTVRPFSFLITFKEYPATKIRIGMS